MSKNGSANGAANGALSADMQRILENQRGSHIAEGAPSAAKRIDWINRSIALLISHQQKIADAISSDFGHRSQEQSLLADVMGSIGPLKHARANLKNG